MQSEADRAARHLESAANLLKMAEQIREEDPETARKLMEVAQSYQRIAAKLMGAIPGQNSN